MLLRDSALLRKPHTGKSSGTADGGGGVVGGDLSAHGVAMGTQQTVSQTASVGGVHALTALAGKNGNDNSVTVATEESCTGCDHARRGRCTFNPKQWAEISTVVGPGMVSTRRGWAFPPADERCGHFRQREPLR